jgi:hypothetical protein
MLYTTAKSCPRVGTIFLACYRIKGTVSGDFRRSVFFVKQYVHGTKRVCI